MIVGVVIGGGFLWSRSRPAPATSQNSQQTVDSSHSRASRRNSTPESAVSSPATSSEAKRLHVLVAADVSRSVDRSLRQNAIDGLKFAFRHGLPGGTPLHVVFYDREARTRPGVVEFYEPRDLDDVSSAFLGYAPRPERGTRQALALSRLMTEAKALPAGTPFAFALLTDGEDHDQKATTQLASQLASSPPFKGLLVVGAKMESKDRIYLRDQLNKALAPLGARKIICGEEVSDREADEFKALLDS